jgi:tetraacyldisaccharide 4'-kinase
MSRLDGLARRWWAGELGAGGTLLDAALWPAEMVFRAVAAARNSAYDRGVLSSGAAAIPVISVGNIAVGGAGKTPFTNWLARLLAERGERPAILHGGYAADEPELHRRWSADIPVYAERDRRKAAAEAVSTGATVLVLDDAFQHRRLRRDLDIVLVSAERWSAAPRLLPRGPWREGPAALQRADLVVVTRKAASAAQALDVARQVKVFCARGSVRVHLRPAGWLLGDGTPADAPGDAALLVAGVAEPTLLAASAREAGATLAGELLFGDHHDYTAADAERIVAAAAGRAIVTSEKDWVRLERWLRGADVRVLRQDVIVEEGAELLEACLDKLLS